MKVRPITTNTFGGKNTFLQKAKLAISSEDKAYYKSLHYEAKSRMYYLKYRKVDNELADFHEIHLKNVLDVAKVVLMLIGVKLNSVIYETKAFDLYPTRFYIADNTETVPHRYYKKNKL